VAMEAIVVQYFLWWQPSHLEGMAAAVTAGTLVDLGGFPQNSLL
jgi:hypothetical protein